MSHPHQSYRDSGSHRHLKEEKIIALIKNVYRLLCQKPRSSLSLCVFSLSEQARVFFAD